MHRKAATCYIMRLNTTNQTNYARDNQSLMGCSNKFILFDLISYASLSHPLVSEGLHQPLPGWDSHLINLLKPYCDHVIEECF